MHILKMISSGLLPIVKGSSLGPNYHLRLTEVERKTDIVNFNDINPNEYTGETFGKCIRERREELGLSVRALAEILEISPVYLSDIERGNRKAPTGANKKRDYMSRLIKTLQISHNEIAAFYDMAEATKGRYVDISSYLDKNKMARLALRLANEGDIPDEEWQQFVDRLLELNASSENNED